MNHRSVPFQFMSIDPAKRQAELEKRFGISKSSDNKMHLDFGNPSLMGMRREPSSASSSPRLQHRVPIFVEGMNEPAQSKADANPTNVDAGQKPRVRVVPIEVETDDMMKRRARAFSGDPYSCGARQNSMRPKDPWFDAYEPKPEFEPPMSGPRVCNIPIKVERASANAKPKSPVKNVPIKKEPVVKTVPVQKEAVPKPQQNNGCNATKQSAPSQEKAPSPLPHEASLKKIAVVLDKLGGYQADVEKFSGTSKEKQYRYLDEMLTRLMLDLDDVETMGIEDVRLKRKDAIRKVQHFIDLLESKVCDNNQATANQDNCQEMVVEPNSDDPKLTDDEEMMDNDVPKLDEVEMKDSEEETKSTEVQVEEAESAASQPVVDGDLPKPEEKTEVVQDIEISEVVESDANPQEEIVSEPIVNEVNESGETVENCPDETLVEESAIQITEMQSDSDSNQSMEVDGAGDKGSVPETVSKLDVDNCNGDVCDPNSIPDTKTDIEMNNQIVKTCDEGINESNLSHPSS